jgi:hypothetical protein
MVVFGGRARFSTLLNDVNILDLEFRRWNKLETVGEKPPKVYGHSGTMISFKDNEQMITRHYLVVLFGRFQQWNRWKESKEMWVLDIHNKAWNKVRLTKEANHPGLYGHTATLVGDKIYIFGGYSGEVGSCINNMRVLNIAPMRDAFAAHQLAEVVPDTPAPAARYGHSAVSFENKIYIFGGSNRTDTFNDIYEYDISSNTWRKPTIGRLAPPRTSHLLSRTPLTDRP